MDPVSMGLGLASIGLSFLGHSKQAQGSREQVQAAQASALAGKDIAQQQLGENQVRRQSMELQTYRANLQDLRDAQAARSRALVAGSANNAGAGGSALGGAYGGISGQLNTGLLNLSQNLTQGRQMFDFSDAISRDRMKQADASSLMATAQGHIAAGKSLSSIAGDVGKLGGAAFGITKGFGGAFSSLFGGMGGSPTAEDHDPDLDS